MNPYDESVPLAEYSWDEFKARPDALKMICEWIGSGNTIVWVGYICGTTPWSVYELLHTHPAGPEALAEAMRAAAMTIDAKAEHAILRANTPHELSKAKELANHYRWRAARWDRARYGDKTDVQPKSTQDVDYLWTEEQAKAMITIASKTWQH